MTSKFKWSKGSAKHRRRSQHVSPKILRTAMAVALVVGLMPSSTAYSFADMGNDAEPEADAAVSYSADTAGQYSSLEGGAANGGTDDDGAAEKGEPKESVLGDYVAGGEAGEGPYALNGMAGGQGESGVEYGADEGSDGSDGLLVQEASSTAVVNIVVDADAVAERPDAAGANHVDVYKVETDAKLKVSVFVTDENFSTAKISWGSDELEGVSFVDADSDEQNKYGSYTKKAVVELAADGEEKAFEVVATSAIDGKEVSRVCTYGSSESGVSTVDKNGNTLSGRSLVIDGTAPAVTVEFKPAEEGKGSYDSAQGKGYFTSDALAVITVKDRNFRCPAALELGQAQAGESKVNVDSLEGDIRGTVESGWERVADADDGTPQHACTIRLTGVAEGGKAKITVDAYDWAGNSKTEDHAAEFVKDDTPPSLTSVTFDPAAGNGIASSGKECFTRARTATITVTETNFDPSLMKVNGEVVAWSDGGGDAHTATVQFTEDGVYTLTIEGSDLAGNKLVSGNGGLAVDGDGKYESEQFGIATKSPLYGVDYEETLLDATPVYPGRTAHVTVTSGAFDETKIQITATKNGDDWEPSVAWSEVPGTNGAQHVATVGLVDSGVYTLTVSGSDSFDRALGWDTTAFPTVVEGTLDGGKYTSSPITVDSDQPTVEVSSSAEPYSVDKRGEKGEVRYFSEAVEMTVSVNDEYLDDGITVQGLVPSWTVNGTENSSTVTFSDEGESTLVVAGFDKAGNGIASESLFVEEDQDGTPFVGNYAKHSNKVELGVVVDKTDPVLSVTWDDDSPKNGTYFASAKRVATLEVVEANFDPDKIRVNGKTVAWSDGAGDSHIATVPFEGDGDYSLVVTGSDKAGRQLVGDNVQDGVYLASFTLDTTSPIVQSVDFAEPISGGFAGVDYFSGSSQLVATIKVSDANFQDNSDAGAELLSTVTASGSVAVQPSAWKSLGGGVYQCMVVFGENSETNPTSNLQFTVYDKAGNSTSYSYALDKAVTKANGVQVPDGSASFTLDVTAPVVAPASSSDIPDTRYSGKYGSGSEAYVFFNSATSLSVKVTDSLGLYSVSLGGGANDYLIQNDSEKEGDTERIVTVSLKDGSEFTRNIVLTVVDIAGNSRIWNISPNGTVVDVAGSPTLNVPLYGGESSLYPVTAVQDTAAPSVALSGVQAGAYYASDQTVRCDVNELNFRYLKRFDSAQQVIRVSKEEGNAGRAQSTWTVPVASFGAVSEGQNPEGLDGLYYHNELFADDGHYSIEAALVDPAGNRSSTARLAEFTIDKTAPQGSLAWDNNDVRNGKYYAAQRTATLTIVEHNFDEGSISIETTGSVGSWSSNGDTHTVQISFDTDGTYTLTVNGADLAGNPMQTIAEDEFVIDMTAPTIEFSGVEDRSAYGKGTPVMPMVSFIDEANFDPDGTSYTITGTKNGEVSYASAPDVTETGATVLYSDFGYSDDGYDPNVDDIYTIDASMTDLAGNSYEDSITFSVNRFGSNYRVVGLDAYTRNEGYLSERTEVKIEEINVTGSDSEKRDVVVTSLEDGPVHLKCNESPQATGYTVSTETSNENSSRGWSLYTYTVAKDNFDHDAHYHVSVASNDRADNANTTTSFYDRDDAVADAVADVSFVLDENAPEIVGLHISGSEIDEFYEGSFSVSENIGLANVEVSLDGEAIDVVPEGGNSYSFKVPSRSFDLNRQVTVTATDLSAKSDVKTADILSLLLLFTGLGVALVAAIVAGVVIAVRKKSVAAN